MPPYVTKLALFLLQQLVYLNLIEGLTYSKAFAISLTNLPPTQLNPTLNVIPLFCKFS
jgi:hypothetical protein